MDCGQVANSAELSTAPVFACDEPTDAVGNSGRTSDIVLGHRFHARQIGMVKLIGGGILNA